MVTGLVAPLGLFWFGRGPLGRQARRRRVRVIAISAFLVPLMAIGPESVLALHDEATLYQAVAAAAIGQTDPTEITYTYDENGNLTKRTAGSATDTYVYDRQNRLVSADLQIDEVRCLSFGYDADGIRNRRTVNGQTTFHLVDPNQPYAQVLAEHNGEGEVSVRYAYGLDLLTQTRGTNTWYYHYDGQLSTRLLTDSAGLPVPGHDAYAYDAFGNLLSGDPNSNNAYLYTGEQLDPDLGFYYLRARYYSHTLGGFLSRDPFQGNCLDPSSLHRYLYAASNPVNIIDPGGELGLGIAAFLAGAWLHLRLAAMNLAIRVAPTAYVLYFRVGVIMMRLFIAMPRILTGLLIASVVLDIGSSMVLRLANNTRPICEGSTAPLRPGEVAAVDRGRMVEEIAGANLRGNVTGIDDFRSGVATSVKSYGEDDPARLLKNIERDLQALDRRTQSIIRGRSADGVQIRILPQSIRAKQLVACLSENSTAWRSSAFVQGIRQLAERYQATVRPAVVRLWTRR